MTSSKGLTQQTQPQIGRRQKLRTENGGTAHEEGTEVIIPQD